MSSVNISYAAPAALDRINMASAVRGRPRGRRPLRGQFPVVPIDMVRQLGIEQQVILQPAAPVAMRNKGILSKPLMMSRRTQCDTQSHHVFVQTDEVSKETAIKVLPIPIPIPLFIPVPCAMYERPVPVPCPIPVPLPVPLPLLFESSEQSLKYETHVAECKKEMIQSIEENASSKRTRDSAVPEELERDIKKARIGEEPSDKKKGSQVVAVASASSTSADKAVRLRYTYGTNAWQHFMEMKAQSQSKGRKTVAADLLTMSKNDLNTNLARFVEEVRKPSGDDYTPDSVFYLCLGIQYYLQENNCPYDIFNYVEFREFNSALDPKLANFRTNISADGLLLCRLEEKYFWEASQMGCHSPQVLLFSIVYMVALKSGDIESSTHMGLKMADVKVLHDRVEITYNGGRRLTVEENDAVEVCPVTLFKTYFGKCHTSPSASAPLYLQPLDAALIDQKQWYESKPASPAMIEHFLRRIRMIKEIQEACEVSQSNVS